MSEEYIIKLKCPNCGKNCETPFPKIEISCYHCGFYTITNHNYLTLEELNEHRTTENLAPLFELPEQKIF